MTETTAETGRRDSKAPLSQQDKAKRSRERANTRHRILEAALDSISKKGFFLTTAKDIAQRARIAEDTLVGYFKTKEDLAVHLLDHELSSLIDWYRRNQKVQEAPLHQKLAAIVRWQFERGSRYADLIGAACWRSLRPGSKLNVLALESLGRDFQYLRFISQILEDSAESGEIRHVGDFGALGFGIFHAAIEMLWLRDSSREKKRTLNVLDSSLKLAASLITRRNWNW